MAENHNKRNAAIAILAILVIAALGAWGWSSYGIHPTTNTTTSTTSSTTLTTQPPTSTTTTTTNTNGQPNGSPSGGVSGGTTTTTTPSIITTIYGMGACPPEPVLCKYNSCWVSWDYQGQHSNASYGVASKNMPPYYVDGTNLYTSNCTLYETN